jgi:soluble lytic murein transglycosylase
MSYAVDAPLQSEISEQDSALIIKALKAIDRKQWQAAENMIASSRDPLAAKLYYWFLYTQNPGDIPFKRLAGFIEQNPDFPRQGRLKLNAEKALTASGGTPRDIINFFSKYGARTPAAMDIYLQTLQSQNRNVVMQDALRAWWKTALITPGQQRSFLNKYGKFIDRKTNIRRLDYLLLHEHYTNANALARLLGKGYPQLASARIALARQSGGVDAKVAAVPPYLQNDPGLLYERLKWRRRHDMDFRAIEILHNMPPADSVTNLKDWWQERHIIARRLIENKQYESAYLLVEKHRQKEGLPFAQAEFLAGWLALRKLDKPWRAFEHFEALYHNTKTPLSRSRGAYWAGRASEELGHPDIAAQWYRVAARHQIAFYGQLSIARLAAEHKPPQQLPPAITIEGKNAFEEQEIVRIIRLLHAAA